MLRQVIRPSEGVPTLSTYIGPLLQYDKLGEVSVMELYDIQVMDLASASNWLTLKLSPPVSTKLYL